MSEEYSGSCLCGEVSYRITGNADRFYHCHCRRCRKATGSGHASNIIMAKPETVSWLQGQELVSRYEVPEAKRFATCFCRQCGSPLPRAGHDMSYVVIPAGSLDDEPALQPQARIFQDSKTSWSCTDDAIPQFSRYPE